MACQIMLVGEAWGREEADQGIPFFGASGRLLRSMLSQVGIDYSQCYVTNVFNFQPRGGGYKDNEIANICGPKAEGLRGFSSVQQGKYIKEQYRPELDRLYSEIKREAPTLIVALGATAAWALLGTSGIKRIRGAPGSLYGPALEAVGAPIKVLPTYHPAAIIREWGLRLITIADLAKARAEAEFPELRRPKREIWIEPTVADLIQFERDYIDPAPDLSIDIETAGTQITCVGFAPTIDRAIVVPFSDHSKPDGNYWSPADERLVWPIVRRWCGLPKAIVGQNFLYDMHFLWRRYGITVPSQADDTMLLHHALQPELEKSLGFLATIYTEELPWKFMREKHETVKKED